MAIDLDGLEAWVSTSVWTKKDITRFAEFAKSYLEKSVKDGSTKYDCADVAVKLMVDYAFEYKLKAEFTLYDGTKVNSDMIKFKNKEQFLATVTGGVNAKTLALNNTHTVQEEQSIVGDMEFEGLQEENKNWIITHTVIAFEINEGKVSEIVYGNPAQPPKTTNNWLRTEDTNVSNQLLGKGKFGVQRWNALRDSNLAEEKMNFPELKRMEIKPINIESKIIIPKIEIKGASNQQKQ